MKQVPLLALFVLTFSGCIKEPITSHTAHWTNKSGFTVTIIPFAGGTPIQNMVVQLKNDSTIKIGDGFNRGLTGNTGFSSDYVQADSFHVIFEGQFKCTHYINAPSVVARKHHLYSSTRNIANFESYQWTQTKPHKNNWYNRYVYEFTEADYLFAKQ